MRADRQTRWVIPDARAGTVSDRQPDSLKLTGGLNQHPSCQLCPAGVVEHVENPGMMQPSKCGSISGPACSHGPNYDEE